MRIAPLVSLLALVAVPASAAEPTYATPAVPGTYLLFDHALIIEPAPPEAWFDGRATMSDITDQDGSFTGSRVFRKLVESALPPAVTALRGAQVTLYRFGSAKPVCRGTIDSFAGRGYVEGYRPFSSGEEQLTLMKHVESLSPEALGDEAWKVGDGLLAGIVKAAPKSNCMGADFAVLGAGAPPPSLTKKKESLKTKLAKDARNVFRSHSFWQDMQARFRKAGGAGKWDEQDVEGGALDIWTFSEGTATRYVLLSVWEAQCSPALGWMLLAPGDDGSFEVVSYLPGAPPEAISDFGNDGVWELTLSNDIRRTVFRVSLSADKPEVLYGHGEKLGVIRCFGGG